MMRSENRKSGFTLIELLVVIAIIALLISLLVPSLARAKELARKVACASNMRNLGLAVTQYHINNDGWLPKSNAEGPFWPDPRDGNFCTEIGPYLGLEDDPWLPLARSGVSGAPAALACPSERNDWDGHILGYAWNWRFMGYIANDSPWWHKRWKEQKIKRPGEVSTMGETRPIFFDGARAYQVLEVTAYWGGRHWVIRDWDNGFYAGRRHDDGLHYVCVDGHVEYIKFDDLIDDDCLGERNIFSTLH